MADIRLSTPVLGTSPQGFEVTVLEPPYPVRTVLFAAGSGGNPTRHLPLLQSLAEHGCSVVAPHFERLTSSVPSGDDFLSRAHRLELAAASLAQPGLPVAGLGHSFGAAALLVLAGGVAHTLAGQSVSVESRTRFDRLVLFTPPTDFFRAPGALDAIDTPVFVWAGAKDTITPPAQAAFLGDALKPGLLAGSHLVEDAGHFTFMNELPPGVADPHPDRAAFLANLAGEVRRIVGAP